jgi:hypothetical protein
MVRLVESAPAETRPRVAPAWVRPLRTALEAAGYILLALGIYFALRIAIAFSRLEYL